MLSSITSLEHPELGTRILLGRGAVASLGELLEQESRSHALIVTGSNVANNSGVIDPLIAGLGERFAGHFRHGKNKMRSVFDGIEVMRETGADLLVGAGGGGSLDVARAMSVFAAAGRHADQYIEEALQGAVVAPDTQADAVPVIVVPTTLAGADLSAAATIKFLEAEESPTGLPVGTRVQIPPTAAFYDPNLFEAAPPSALYGSAMNGFNKGLDGLWAMGSTPVTDAILLRGMQLLRRGLLELVAGDTSGLDAAVEATVLLQLGKRTSALHAFGHGFSRQYVLHQGLVHAVAATHVTRLLLDRLSGHRRSLFVEALDLDHSASEVSTDAIVDRVAELRDSMELPTRFSDIVDPEEFDLERTARLVHSDRILARMPRELELTIDDITAVLQEAW